MSAQAFQDNAFQTNAFQAINPLQVTDTIVKMQLPINCVLGGDQREEKKIRYITDFAGLLKNIFRE